MMKRVNYYLSSRNKYLLLFLAFCILISYFNYKTFKSKITIITRHNRYIWNWQSVTSRNNGSIWELIDDDIAIIYKSKSSIPIVTKNNINVTKLINDDVIMIYKSNTSYPIITLSIATTFVSPNQLKFVENLIGSIQYFEPGKSVYICLTKATAKFSNRLKSMRNIKLITIDYINLNVVPLKCINEVFHYNKTRILWIKSSYQLKSNLNLLNDYLLTNKSSACCDNKTTPVDKMSIAQEYIAKSSKLEYTKKLIKIDSLQNKLKDLIVPLSSQYVEKLNDNPIQIWYNKDAWFGKMIDVFKCSKTCIWNSTNIANADLYILDSYEEFYKFNGTKMQPNMLLLRPNEKLKQENIMTASFDINSDLFITHSPSPTFLFQFRTRSWQYLQGQSKIFLYEDICTDQIRQFMDTFDSKLRIISYGKCQHNTKLPSYLENDIKLEHSFYSFRLSKALIIKRIGLGRLHMFQLIFQSFNYDIIEEIFLAVTSGTIPIYLGNDCERIRNYVPHHSIICASDFKNLKELSVYIVKVSTNYNNFVKHHNWRTGQSHQMLRIPPLLTDIINLKSTFCNICNVAMRYKYKSLQKQSTLRKLEAGIVTRKQTVNFQRPLFKADIKTCNANDFHRLGIVIPFRDNSKNNIWKYPLDYISLIMKVYLASRGIFGSVIAVEQSDNKLFNRAKLFNVGFRLFVDKPKNTSKHNMYSTQCYDYFCYMDAEYFPITANDDYRYPDVTPVHPPSIYSCRPPSTFKGGGVLCTSISQLLDMGGWPNSLFGYGGEDKVIVIRAAKAGYDIYQPTNSMHACYSDIDLSFKHPETFSKNANDKNLAAARLSSSKWPPVVENTVSGCKYNVKQVQKLPGYTKVSVSL